MTEYQIFSQLVGEVFGNKTKFAAYVGLRKQTVYGWKTPPSWAMLLLREMIENRRNKQIIESLGNVRDEINKVLG